MKISGINSYSLISFKSQNEQTTDNAQKSNFQFDKKKLLYAGIGTLAATGTLALIVNNVRKGKINTPKTKTIQQTFTTSKGEKLVVDFSDGKVIKAEKSTPDGKIIYRKEYTRNGDKLTVPKFTPNTDGNLEISRLLVKTKESIGQYLNDKGLIDKYFRKIGNHWKRVDERLTKEQVPMCSARGIYLDSGQMINRFLRSGEFYNYKSTDGKFFNLDEFSPEIRKCLEYDMKGVYDTNRQIIDSIEMIDAKTHSSHTTRPMVVYRDAPIQWLKTAKDGKLIDLGYCSTSTERGASLEGMLSKEPTMTYEIELGENVPYWDLTDTTEKEMLLPRGSEFLILGHNKLRYLGPIKK